MISAVKPDAKTGNQLLSEGKAAQAIIDAYNVTKKFKDEGAGSLNVTNTAEMDDHQLRRDDGKLVKIGHRSVKLSQEVLDLVKIDDGLRASVVTRLRNAKKQHEFFDKKPHCLRFRERLPATDSSRPRVKLNAYNAPTTTRASSPHLLN